MCNYSNEISLFYAIMQWGNMTYLCKSNQYVQSSVLAKMICAVLDV